jgi:hypothetical protein
MPQSAEAKKEFRIFSAAAYSNSPERSLGILDTLNGAHLADNGFREVEERFFLRHGHGIPTPENKVQRFNAVHRPYLGQGVRFKSRHQLDENVGF